MDIDQDYSDNFNILRERLTAEVDGQYRTFLQGLTPDYKRVWMDIGFGYLMLAIVLFLVGLHNTIPWAVFAAPLGAVFIGYWFAYLQLFIHEGAHYNLAPNRKLNDRLCNLFIALQVGTTIRDYRVIHFQHHRKLGLHDDSERSYFNPLTKRFLAEMIFGIHPIRVFMLRRNLRQEGGEKAQREWRPLLTGVAMHLVLLTFLVACGAWVSALAWIGGVGVFFPFFATIRQLLEHRSVDADPKADYSKTDHGALTRLFGSGFFARTFGGAGFNRHLLHHWEPQISYTRLGDFEHYLMKTSIAPILESRRSSYLQIFRDLYRHDNSG